MWKHMVKVGNGKARFNDAFVLEASAADVGSQWSWCWSDVTALAVADHTIMMMMMIYSE